MRGLLLTDAKFDQCRQRKCVTDCQPDGQLFESGKLENGSSCNCIDGRVEYSNNIFLYKRFPKVLNSEILVADIMEKYKKVSEIGQGSYGRVALVQEKKGKGRKLVLKEVEIKRMAEGEQEKVTTKGNQSVVFLLNKVMREVRLLSELDHPHVVQYVESFTEAGCVHMVSRGKTG